MSTYSPKRFTKLITSTNSARSITLDSIPWEVCRNVYLAAADVAEETLNAEFEERYRVTINELARLHEEANPEEGAYEGNFNDSHLLPQKPDPSGIRDAAGNEAILDAFVKPFNLIDHVESFMPQIITKLAGMTLHKNENGLISGLRFRNENFTTPAMKGLYRFLMLNSRSGYLKTQYKGTNKNYCALVPLIMYAHKLVHRVPYTAWDPTEIHYVVNSQLAEAMLYVPSTEFTADQLLDQRMQGLLVRSGDKEGTYANPVWKHRLTGPQLKTGIFKDTPYLAQVMYVQIWCAHPDNRTSYMILDPVNWNRMPLPLVAKEPLLSTTAAKSFFQENSVSSRTNNGGWND